MTTTTTTTTTKNNNKMVVSAARLTPPISSPPLINRKCPGPGSGDDCYNTRRCQRRRCTRLGRIRRCLVGAIVSQTVLFMIGFICLTWIRTRSSSSSMLLVLMTPATDTTTIASDVTVTANNHYTRKPTNNYPTQNPTRNSEKILQPLLESQVRDECFPHNTDEWLSTESYHMHHEGKRHVTNHNDKQHHSLQQQQQRQKQAEPKRLGNHMDHQDHLKNNDSENNNFYYDNENDSLRLQQQSLPHILVEGPSNFNNIPTLLAQTLTPSNSILRRVSTTMRTSAKSSITPSLSSSVEDWYHRLLLFAIHTKFHNPARDEFRARRTCLERDRKFGTTHTHDFLQRHNIGSMDYECSSTTKSSTKSKTKFVVSPIASVGMGAFLNTQAMLTMIVAFRTNRIPIFAVNHFFPWQVNNRRIRYRSPSFVNSTNNSTSNNRDSQRPSRVLPYSYVADPWLLAPLTCPRQDFQCYFLPLSPCVVSVDELEHARASNWTFGTKKSDQLWLRQNKNIPPHLQGARIVVLNSGLSGFPVDDDEIAADLTKITLDIVNELIDGWKEQQAKGIMTITDDEWTAINEARKWIQTKSRQDPFGLLRLMYVYLLRPNSHYRSIIEQRASEMLSTQEQQHQKLIQSAGTTTTTTTTTARSQPSSSEVIGMAIRGSDKCITESTCLPFQRYMELASEIAFSSSLASSAMSSANENRRRSHISGGDDRPKLFITTEDPGIYNQSIILQHESNMNMSMFPYHIVLNRHDNLQGGGYPREFKDDGENVVISSLTSLYVHLHTNKVFLNCCSNFHVIIKAFIHAQCGVNRHGHGWNSLTSSSTADWQQREQKQQGLTHDNAVAVCLNDATNGLDSKFRICCGSGRGHDNINNKDECTQIWNSYSRTQSEFMKQEGNKHYKKVKKQ